MQIFLNETREKLADTIKRVCNILCIVLFINLYSTLIIILVIVYPNKLHSNNTLLNAYHLE